MEAVREQFIATQPPEESSTVQRWPPSSGQEASVSQDWVALHVEVPQHVLCGFFVPPQTFAHVGPIHFLVSSALEIGFAWDFGQEVVDSCRPVLSSLLGKDTVATDLCMRKGFRGESGFDPQGKIRNVVEGHSIWRCLELVFYSVRLTLRIFLCRFCGGPDGDGHFVTGLFFSPTCSPS